MSVELFRDDDRGYVAWLAGNAGGYVLNIQRGLNPVDARLHHAACRTISGTPPRGRTWTGPYIKACSVSLTELDAWALSQAGAGIIRCGICHGWHGRSSAQPAARTGDARQEVVPVPRADSLHSAEYLRRPTRLPGPDKTAPPGASAHEGVPWPVRRSPHGERRNMAPAGRYSMKAVN
jgi:hypothetical protein